MIPSNKQKIVFAGSVGAGKTTAIRALSDIDTLSTDVESIEQFGGSKKTTTVAMDFGKLVLSDKSELLLYGTPGQDRFRFMWPIVCKSAMGIIILIDGSAKESLGLLEYYLAALRDYIGKVPTVIGVTFPDREQAHSLVSYTKILTRHGHKFPVLSADAREKDDILVLVNALISMVEAQATLIVNE